MKCKNCGSTKLRMTDHDAMDIQSKEQCENDDYERGIDTYFYATIKCDNCGEEKGVDGEISFSEEI